MISDIILIYISFKSFRAKVGKLVVLNGTDDEWKIAVYPHVVGKISKEEKKIKVRTIISYKYSYL